MIRRLPPDIPEAIFWKSIDTALGDDVDAVDIRAFVPGKVRNRCVGTLDTLSVRVRLAVTASSWTPSVIAK